MTFTYNLSSPNDITRVRFHIGDTVQDEAILSDEEISFAISESTTWQTAVIWCIDYIIQQLSRESGQKLDWLEIDRKDALKYYTALRGEKRRLFGVDRGAISGSTVEVSRSDYE